MDTSDGDIVSRGRAYAVRCGLRLLRELGHGKDGRVWATDASSAVKVLQREDLFLRELAVFERLAERRVSDILGFAVPQLLRADASLLAVEMTIVEPPYVLDFASAFLDHSVPDFPPEVRAERLERCKEVFGHDWPRIRVVVAHLAGLGVHLLDVHPGNIDVGHEPD